MMNPPLQKDIKKAHIALKLLVFILVAVIFLSSLFYGQLGEANPTDTKDRLFVVEHGTSSVQIANILEKEGFIKNSRAFMIYIKLTGNAQKLKAGQYLLNSSLTVPQIVDKLVQGKVAMQSFTIPEGYHLRQIAEVFAKQGIATEDEFRKVVKEGDFNFAFLKEIPETIEAEKRLEGYLFPDTYTIPRGMAAEDVIEMMLKRFDTVYQQLPPNKTGLTVHEVVTLASIIEGESMLDKERPVIASVFFNRLKIGQRLEADSTIQYLFEERKKRVLYKDLEIASPYNTYRNKGLPPGPIGSPGEASLRAVLEPDDNGYYYFVARKDNSGEHVFSKTLAEHNRNKRKLGY